MSELHKNNYVKNKSREYCKVNLVINLSSLNLRFEIEFKSDHTLQYY